MHLLIMSCSAAKDPTPAPMPAILRYKGMPYLILNRHRPDTVRVIVMSAEHGFIDGSQPIENYDRKLDPERSRELADSLGAAWLRQVARETAGQIHISGSSLYRAFAQAALGAELCAALGDRLTVPVGRHGRAPAIGEINGHLKAWLLSIGETK